MIFKIMSRFLARKSPWYWCLLGAGSLGWLGLVAGARAANDTKDATDSAVVQLQAFEVTGSRVKRLEADGPQPVVVYTADEIEARGFDLFGDFVQSLPFNSAGSPSVLQMEKTYRGLTAINPRGLGSGRFLVLVDGHRAAPYALNDAGRSYFDFNSIPLGAIERIEYEKDGASAIYGADAMTGVISVKLKQNFRGIATGLMVGNTLGHDTLTRSADVLIGVGDPRQTSLLVDVSWFKQNANFIRDYDRSKTTSASCASGWAGTRSRTARPIIRPTSPAPLPSHEFQRSYWLRPTANLPGQARGRRPAHIKACAPSG